VAEAKRGEAAVRRGEISRRPAMYLPPLCFDAIPEAAGYSREKRTRRRLFINNAYLSSAHIYA